MVCIYCRYSTRVTNSRRLKADNSVWRRRKCQKCGAIFTTKESTDLEQAVRVLKRNGKLEPFYRDKLFLSIYKACEHLKAPVSLATALSNTVLRRVLKDNSNTIVSSDKIALISAKVIKRYDAAAGVRYLSYQTPMKLANDVRKSLK
jgi:transcriptional repressor NrdR